MAQAIEARPGNRALVHHILVYYEAPPDGPRATRDPAESRGQPDREPSACWAIRPPRETDSPSRLLATYAPGTEAQVFPAGTALRPGRRVAVLHLQVHYTANGTAGTDRSKVGLIFAKEPPAEEIRAAQFLNGRFTIPAGRRGSSRSRPT